MILVADTSFIGCRVGVSIRARRLGRSSQRQIGRIRLALINFLIGRRTFCKRLQVTGSGIEIAADEDAVIIGSSVASVETGILVSSLPRWWINILKDDGSWVGLEEHFK